MSYDVSKTSALFKQAKQFIPNGVNSNFRYWGDDYTLVVAKGEGPYIWDADGNRYIDYRLGFGPVILGHGYGPVVERVAEAIPNGTVFAWTMFGPYAGQRMFTVNAWLIGYLLIVVPLAFISRPLLGIR